MRSNQPDEIEREVVDFDILADWMGEHRLPTGPFQDVVALGGGTQNVLIGFTRGGQRFVLRRGPRHLRKASNEVMRREQQVLAALKGSAVPHPGFVAGETDETVMDGAVFYLMEPIDGFNATVAMPELHKADAEVRHGMGLQAAEGAARLGAVDHVAVGLADFGKPDGFLERQVPRWMGELDGYSQFDGYPGPDIPGLEEVAAWLDANRPTDWFPGIMHGDYHLANLMFSPTGPELAAIVDWEMCTIGDPLLDLGWLLATWPDPDGTPLAAAASVVTGTLGSLGGLPRPAELVAYYAERSDRDLDAIDWYTVLACFKLGIVLEGTHARACAGKAPKPTGDLLHAITLGLFARARSVMSGG